MVPVAFDWQTATSFVEWMKVRPCTHSDWLLHDEFGNQLTPYGIAMDFAKAIGSGQDKEITEGIWENHLRVLAQIEEIL